MSQGAGFYPEPFRPSSCRFRCAAAKDPFGRRITTISTSQRTRSSLRSCATFIAIRSTTRSSAASLPSPRSGFDQAIAIIKRACTVPWKSNRIGRPAREAGKCMSGCATDGSALPPRSPKARDRGHPQLDNARYETRAARRNSTSCVRGKDLRCSRTARKYPTCSLGRRSKFARRPSAKKLLSTLSLRSSNGSGDRRLQQPRPPGQPLRK